VEEQRATICSGDADGGEVEARKVTVYFLIQSVSDSWGINAVFDKLRPASGTRSTADGGWCTGSNALKNGVSGVYSAAILDIDVNVETLRQARGQDTQVRREGAGRCIRSGRSNCGDHADCIDTPQGHECICQSGYKRGDTATSCVASGTQTAGNINEARRSGDYLSNVNAVQTTAQCPDGACSGMTTYRLEVTLSGGATNVYAMFGEDEAHPLDLPPAYQAPKPFGVDVGGVNPVMFALTSGEHRPQHDSWVTIADRSETQGMVGQISTIGIDWDCWQDHDVFDSLDHCADRGGAIHITDGAVFWMDPDSGPDGVDTSACPGRTDNQCPIVLAQVTLSSTDRPVRVGAQGRHPALDNWKDYPVRARANPSRPQPYVVGTYTHSRLRLTDLCRRCSAGASAIAVA
jgi:hypothetical protein